MVFRKLLLLFGKFILFGIISAFVCAIGVAIFSLKSTIHELDFRDNAIPVSEETEWNLVNDTNILHHRIWNDYSSNTFKMIVGIPTEDYELASRAKKSINPRAYKKGYWGSIYQQLIDFDEPRLKALEDSFAEIGTANGMSTMEFVNTVVSFVQDIPYVLVTPDDCFHPTDVVTKSYVSQGIPCVGLQRFGIHSPIEFMSTLEGDCDTRTVFCYMILVHFGFEVAVLGSNHFRHSILAVHLPANGAYKEIRGKKFYTWETTAPRLQLGQLSPSMSNMTLWNVELLNINSNM